MVESHSTHPDVLLVVANMAAVIYAMRVANPSVENSVQMAVQIYLEANNQLKTQQVN